jgi:hypothetical protein
MISLSNSLREERDLEKQIEIEYEETYENEDSIEQPPNDIIAFNELRSCADILRMVTKKQLKINPDFQRQAIWTEAAQTRFIDSLMKQLPIPSMSISLDYKTEERLVVDGLQRISTIIKFLEEKSDWRLSNIKDIDSRIKGKSVQEIKQDYPELYSRIENLSLPITVIRFDSSKKRHMDYLFTIFHRLNTGGTKLNNQEIRNCIYQGIFNDLLKECATYEAWKKVSPLRKSDKKKKSQESQENVLKNRFENEEFILRFFAFFDEYKYYSGRLSEFLNGYMDKQKKLEKDKKFNENNKIEKYILFTRTIDLILNKFPDRKKLLDMSKVIMEGLLIGVAKNLDYLETVSQEDFQAKFLKLRQSSPYAAQNLAEGLLQKSKVESRLNTAIDMFSK